MRIAVIEAADRLRNGEVVAVPTETVYGLAASLNRPEAIQHIFRLKSRPKNNPLIIHVASPSDIQEYVSIVPTAFDKLAAAFWPGPLTLVIGVNSNIIPPIATAGLLTAAFRIPRHPLALELLSLTGPLVMPSANLSGKPSATNAAHVEEDFGETFPVLDGGQCHAGVESTILIWNSDRWCAGRLGAISLDELGEVLGYMPEVINRVKSSGAPICPGQMYRHYAPKALLTLSRDLKLCREVVIGFDNRIYPNAEKVYSLGSSIFPEDAAQRLYAVLRQLDADGVERATIDIDIPKTGLWMTLHERLEKAARG